MKPPTKKQPAAQPVLLGLPPEQVEEISARFWTKVEKTKQCWVWVGSLNINGYGKASVKGRYRQAHRIAWELQNGPVPEGKELDHVCRNRACVNPEHLDAVTHRENILRSDSITAERARATACIHGHEFSQENTRRARNGNRQCRRCAELSSRVRNVFETRPLQKKGPQISIEVINEALDSNLIGRHIRPLLSAYSGCDPFFYRQIAKSLYDAYRVGRNENQNNLK